MPAALIASLARRGREGRWRVAMFVAMRIPARHCCQASRKASIMTNPAHRLGDQCPLAETLAEAKALRINVSQAAEAGVARAVAEKRAELLGGQEPEGIRMLEMPTSRRTDCPRQYRSFDGQVCRVCKTRMGGLSGGSAGRHQQPFATRVVALLLPLEAVPFMPQRSTPCSNRGAQFVMVTRAWPRSSMAILKHPVCSWSGDGRRSSAVNSIPGFRPLARNRGNALRCPPPSSRIPIPLPRIASDAHHLITFRPGARAAPSSGT